MEKIITDFGVQPIYLAAQAVNFIILFVILRKFLYQPILEILDKRKNMVAESTADAERIKRLRIEAETESDQIIFDATQQAKFIINSATERANKIIANAHSQAHEDVQLIIAKGKENLNLERNLMKQAMYDDFAGLLVLGIEKISTKVVAEPEHLKLIENTVANLKDKLYKE